MQTKSGKKLDESPFYGLFQKHPWLVPVLGLFNRQLGPIKNFVNQEVGILREFYEIHVKPFND